MPAIVMWSSRVHMTWVHDPWAWAHVVPWQWNCKLQWLTHQVNYVACTHCVCMARLVHGVLLAVYLQVMAFSVSGHLYRTLVKYSKYNVLWQTLSFHTHVLFYDHVRYNVHFKHNVCVLHVPSWPLWCTVVSTLHTSTAWSDIIIYYNMATMKSCRSGTWADCKWLRFEKVRGGEWWSKITFTGSS